jgi:hypothetical protein
VTSSMDTTLLWSGDAKSSREKSSSGCRARVRDCRNQHIERPPSSVQESAHEHSATKSESHANTKTGRTSSSLNIQRFCNCVDGICHAGVLSIVNKFYF